MSNSNYTKVKHKVKLRVASALISVCFGAELPKPRQSQYDFRITIIHLPQVSLGT